MWQENQGFMRVLSHLMRPRRMPQADRMQVAYARSAQPALATPTDVAAEIRDVLVFHLGVDEVRVTEDTRLAEELGADRLDLVEIAMSCEERFRIDIPNRAAEGFQTVGDVLRFVEAALAAPTKSLRHRGQLLSAFG